MKVVAWILFVLSILVIPICAIVGSMGLVESFMYEAMFDMIMAGVVGFIILGFISHAFISFSKGKGSKDGKVLFILTYPAFIIPVAFVFAVLYILSMIDLVIYIWTGKRYISGAIKWLKSIISPYKTDYDIEQEKKREEEKNKVDVFIVEDEHHMERKLTYTSWQGKQLKTDYNDKSPYYSQTYQIFVDDLGNIWRSYDGAKTFIKEDYNHDIV